LMLNATSFILFHNHPSGSLKPSKQDLLLTQDLELASKTMDINFLDHIIVSTEGYLSIKDYKTTH